MDLLVVWGVHLMVGGLFRFGFRLKVVDWVASFFVLKLHLLIFFLLWRSLRVL